MITLNYYDNFNPSFTVPLSLQTALPGVKRANLPRAFASFAERGPLHSL
jgi:hypothetical protein